MLLKFLLKMEIDRVFAMRMNPEGTLSQSGIDNECKSNSLSKICVKAFQDTVDSLSIPCNACVTTINWRLRCSQRSS